LAHNESGAVAFEFALVVIPILVIFLAVVQVALIGAARLLVIDAATRAARSAAVVIDDAPSRYGGEPAGRITPQAKSGDSLFAYRSSSVVALGAAFTSHDGRLDTIRHAASLPLAALAPSPAKVLGWIRRVRPREVAGSLGATLARTIFGIAAYDDAVLAVTPSLGADDSVRVKVDYLYHCSVPLASRLLCKRLAAVNLPDVPSRRDLLMIAATGERFASLRAESTWPRQRYHHRGGGV
jgi:hypothetical protein